MKDPVAEWLNIIELKHSEITPDLLIELATDPDCPAHGYFEWDDEKAGHAHRLSQARTLLARKVVVSTESYELQVPRYVRNPDAPSNMQSYLSTRSINVASMQQQTLAQEFVRVRQMLERARGLAKLFEMVQEVDDMITTVNALTRRVKHREEAVQ